MLKAICADFTDSAPADNTGSTICRSLTSSVACPLSLARIAISNARGSSPAMSADSRVTVPLQANAPVSADALRPWLASVIRIDTRPAGIASAR
jgi:hypothetical protein